MNDFWSRKREELQQQGVLPKPSEAVSNAPWWAQGTKILPQEVKEPPRLPQRQTGTTGQACPVCGSGNYAKPTPSTAARCFDCGNVEGRRLNEPNLPSGLLNTGAATLKVKQLQSGGHFGSTVAEINQNNAVLEQSAQGKAQLA